jgi:hypothetical protein
MTEFLGIAGLFVLVAGLAISIRGICVEFHRFRGLRAYAGRGCQGRAWKRAFPEATADDIRTFLGLFTGAFIMRRRRGLTFAPADSVLAVYRSCYPRWSGDQCELERFVWNCRNCYGVDVEPIWRDGITLGELFDVTRRPK